MSGLITDPILPPPFLWALALLLAAGTAYVYYTVGERLGRGRNLTLLACRLVALGLVLVILWQPSRRQPTPERQIQQVLLLGVDSSRSMLQRDAEHITRLGLAKKTLREANVLAGGPGESRLFLFDAEAAPLSPAALEGAKALGTTTHLHRAVETMVGSLSPQEAGSALVLLTDGHDFELVNPVRTAGLARARHLPIYAIPLGEHGHVRDAALNITNFEPYSYAQQKAHIGASVRLIGCEHEKLSVQLLRQGQIMQTLQVDTGEERELPVSFEVTEPQAGQYEYEIRVQPLAQEADVRNNSAITFLNVIDQRIRVLLLEGAPYWDTTFLRRSLGQNDKIDLDAILQYTSAKARRIRNVNAPQTGPEPAVPTTQAQFNAYDLIILGKSVDSFFNRERYAMLVSFVKDHGGSVIFSRGQAFQGELAASQELEPMVWADRASDRVQLKVEREGQLLSPFRILAEDRGGVAALPGLLGARRMGDRKTLAALLAQAHDTDSGADSPAMVHRRSGRGQVLSVAVEGLWRWSFNPKAAATNNVFDRFWDQLVLWLVAGGDATPSQPFTLRASTANLVLGTKMHLRLNIRDPQATLAEVPLTIFAEEKELSRTVLQPAKAEDHAHLVTEYLPTKVGRYRAVAALPGGKTLEVKWMVFEDNPEEKEVAADLPYLKTLCESTGGRLLQPRELGPLAQRLREHTPEPLTRSRLVPVWDHAWLFDMIGAALGLDWYLRRKWGLC